MTAQQTLWAESSLPRVRKCGRDPVGAGGIAVKASGRAGAGRRAGFAGLHSCGSVWACAVCAAKISATRQGELQQGLSTWAERGHTVTMITLTMRHHKGQALADLWNALAKAWTAVTSGKAWQQQKARYGVAGWCRLVEVTHGKAGWHVHVHALLFTFGDCQWSSADLGPLMFQRWRRGLMRAGLRAPSAGNGGLHCKVLTGDTTVLGDYFTKGTYHSNGDQAERAALEVARGDLKDARHGNRTPFRVLADLVEHGEVRDLDLWHEWEQGSYNRRQLTWSQGFRAQLVVAQELTDAQIAEQDQGGDVLLVLDLDAWRQALREQGRGLLLGLAESDDTGDNLRAYLRSRGWGWSTAGVGESATARAG